VLSHQSEAQTAQKMTASAQIIQGALPPLIPREILFGNPQKAGPQVSPDGRRLAYLAPDQDVLNVWVRTLGQNDDRPVTSDRKRGVRMFVWQGDSEHILYIQDQDGDENWHVYQTSLKTKLTRDLTPFQGVNAQIAAVNPEYPDRILVALNIRDPRLHDVYRVSLENGAVEMDTENPGDVNSWAVDNRMQVRVAQVVTPDGGMEIRVREDSGSPWRVLTMWGPDESFGGVAGFTPDDRAVWLISSVDANAARLIAMDIATGESRVLAEDPQYDAGGLLRHPRTHALEAIRFTRARSEWTLLDSALQADFDVLKGVRDGDFNVVSRDYEDRTWIVSYVMDDGPVYYYAYDRATKAPTLLFSNQPALEQYRLAQMRPVSFPARDGLTLYSYLTLPVGVEPMHLPTVLLVHGGPWGRDVWGYNSLVQWLANRGYAVLQINFRGSAGYGKAHLNAGNREWAGRMHDDLLDGKEWAIQQGYADPQNVAIMGGSYGGYATLVGVTFTPDAFVCGVDIVGPSNLITLMQTIPPYWEPMKAMFRTRLGDLETEADLLKARSPLFKADRIKVPLLIAQGANDPRVKQAESDQIVEAMRKNGKPVEYLVFPDEGHGFARPENNRKFFAAAEAFLAQYLGGRAEPPSDAERTEDLRK
jgi:dipeptidyl aminopeptidase/acylaminoacyl peptidase